MLFLQNNFWWYIQYESIVHPSKKSPLSVSPDSFKKENRNKVDFPSVLNSFDADIREKAWLLYYLLKDVGRIEWNKKE